MLCPWLIYKKKQTKIIIKKQTENTFSRDTFSFLHISDVCLWKLFWISFSWFLKKRSIDLIKFAPSSVTRCLIILKDQLSLNFMDNCIHIKVQGVSRCCTCLKGVSRCYTCFIGIFLMLHFCAIRKNVIRNYPRQEICFCFQTNPGGLASWVSYVRCAGKCKKTFSFRN